MKIALDVMGFENDISHAIIAARKFKSLHKNVNFVLVGDKNKIAKLIKSNEFEIVHADEIISMDTNPLVALRNTKSSMYISIDLVARNICDGVLSAGNSGCYISLVHFLIGTIKNVAKPGFMPFLPTIKKGKYFALVDAGANSTCDGNDLFNFAKIASIYIQNIDNINHPRIGVINIGTEQHKGLEYHHVANNLLLSDKKINYLGFIEPRHLMEDIVEVAVCDGYTGNLVLKSCEGTGKAISYVLKSKFKMPWNYLGALFSIPALISIKKTFDYENKAGAVVIGVNKPVVKTHGSANKQQFFSAMILLHKIITNNITNKIKKAFSK